jgi:hypothetical protein
MNRTMTYAAMTVGCLMLTACGSKVSGHTYHDNGGVAGSDYTTDLPSVAPDNSLRGSGSAVINGKLVSAMNGDNITSTSHSETCTVGNFVAKTGAS